MTIIHKVFCSMRGIADGDRCAMKGVTRKSVTQAIAMPLKHAAVMLATLTALTTNTLAATQRNQVSLLQSAARSQNKTLVIYLHAQWCGPCKAIDAAMKQHQELRALLAEDVLLHKVDADSPVGEQLMKQYDVDALPAMLVIDERGGVKARVTNRASLDVTKAEQLTQYLRMAIQPGDIYASLLQRWSKAEQRSARLALQLLELSIDQRDNAKIVRWEREVLASNDPTTQVQALYALASYYGGVAQSFGKARAAYVKLMEHSRVDEKHTILAVQELVAIELRLGNVDAAKRLLLRLRDQAAKYPQMQLSFVYNCVKHKLLLEEALQVVRAALKEREDAQMTYYQNKLLQLLAK